MHALRGHHLICLHFFNGEGYDQTFIDNLQGTLNSVKSEGLEIKSGDVCSRCPYLENDSCRYSEDADTEVREMDRKALELLCLADGKSVGWHSITSRIPEIFDQWFNAYCAGCEWLPACEKNDFFRKVRGFSSSQ